MFPYKETASLPFSGFNSFPDFFYLSFFLAFSFLSTPSFVISKITRLLALNVINNERTIRCGESWTNPIHTSIRCETNTHTKTTTREHTDTHTNTHTHAPHRHTNIHPHTQTHARTHMNTHPHKQEHTHNHK